MNCNAGCRNGRFLRRDENRTCILVPDDFFEYAIDSKQTAYSLTSENHYDCEDFVAPAVSAWFADWKFALSFKIEPG